MKYSRLVFFLRLALTGLALWLMALALIDGYGQQDRVWPADVIVVLGSKVYSGGQPGPTLIRRTRHAAALFRQGLAPHLICSGGRGEYPPSEAEAACALAQTLGVPASAIALEDESHSTEENALYTAALMRAHGWTAAIVVTDGFHLYRTDMLFRRAGVVAYTSPAQITAGPMGLLERYARGTRELAALLWYWGKTALNIPATDFP
jgi:uncharacterized SAM-binding protein YcdF (DUF218 family)